MKSNTLRFLAFCVVALQGCDQQSPSVPKGTTTIATPNVAPVTTATPSPAVPAHIGPLDLYLSEPVGAISDLTFNKIFETQKMLPQVTIEQMGGKNGACFFHNTVFDYLELVSCDEARQLAETGKVYTQDILSVEDGLKALSRFTVDRELFGEKTTITLNAKNGFVQKISITKHTASTDQVATYLQALNKTYGLVAPTKSEVDDFDTLRTPCVAWSSNTAQVVARIMRDESIEAIGQIVLIIDYDTPEGNKPTLLQCGPRSLIDTSKTKL